MDVNNPAGRLLNILTEGKAANKNESCREVWAKILGVEESDSFLLIGRVGKVFSLADSISIELKKIDNIDIARYMSWTKFLESAFSNCNLSSNWNEFIKHINEPVLDYLHMTSGMLSTNCPQPVLPRNDLENIFSGAKDLIEEITIAKLPDNIKRYFILQLRKIIAAIEEYKITGAAEIVDIVQATFGKAVLSNDIIDGKATNEAMGNFWKFMANTALVVSTVVGLIQIADYTKKAFPELASSKEIIITSEENKP